MNNFYKLLRFTTLIALMMVIPTVLIGALPETTTVLGTHLYKINLAIWQKVSTFAPVFEHWKS